MTSPASRAALTVAGFGPVGAACAIACSMRLVERRIVILDGRAPALTSAPPHADPRMIAISEGSRLLLQRLGAWDASSATPIREIHVSQRGSFGRTMIEARDYRLPALGYVIAYQDLAGMLQRRVEQLGIEVQRTRLSEISEIVDQDVGRSDSKDASSITLQRGRALAHGLRLSLEDGSILESCYLVHAEGGTFGEQAAKPISRPYHQHALTALVTSSHPLAGRAYERFTLDGPIALLPTQAAGAPCYALVWCAKPRDCERRMQLDEDDFLRELGREFGQRVGRFTTASARASYPLGLNVTSHWPRERELGIGNAAQTLHPVAGQGFNLGLRDAMQLSEALSTWFDEPRSMARQFAARRRLDRGATVGLTDFLPRAFAIALPLAGSMRGLALTLLDLVPAVRHPVARQMMNGRR